MILTQKDEKSDDVLQAYLYLRVLSEMKIELGLDRVKKVWKGMDLNKHTYRTVLVGGTNGKGSAALTLSHLLNKNSVKTGLYVSPHLIRVTERIMVGGDEVSEEELAKAILKVKEKAESLQIHLTYFEVLTLASLHIFSENKVSLAVLEVGMGGRLDATNIVNPDLSIITSISLDHQAYLGNTVEKIAWEKAHILRDMKYAVISSYLTPYIFDKEIEMVKRKGAISLLNAILKMGIHPYGQFLYPLSIKKGIEKRYKLPESISDLAQSAGFELKGIRFNYLSGGRWEIDDGEEKYTSPFLGGALSSNVVVGVEAFKRLSRKEISGSQIRKGLVDLRYPGRADIRTIDNRRFILFDGAHNPEGIENLIKLIDEVGGKYDCVFSCLNDKPCSKMLERLIPSVKSVTIIPAPSLRTSKPSSVLKSLNNFTEKGVEIKAVDNGCLEEVLKRLGGAVLITGSLYLVGEGLKLIESRALPPFRRQY